jgi:hypothetical protein
MSATLLYRIAGFVFALFALGHTYGFLGLRAPSVEGAPYPTCQSRMKIPHFAGRKFPTPKPYKAASLASDAVEPSAVLWRVLGEPS